MNTMKYKGYQAKIEYDEEDRIFVGKLLGISDIVVFHGASVDELETAFHESVDDYLEISEKTGRLAHKPYSGKMLVRMPPELHKAVSITAEAVGVSTNQWVATALSEFVKALDNATEPSKYALKEIYRDVFKPSFTVERGRQKPAIELEDEEVVKMAAALIVALQEAGAKRKGVSNAVG